jgi:hypothetical protein
MTPNGWGFDHVKDEKCSAKSFLSGNPAPGAKTIFGRLPSVI